MKIKYNNKKINLPDAIIVGAAKSGTTALYKFLGDYDSVFVSKIKEPWFFSHFNREFKLIHPITEEDLSCYKITDLDIYSDLFNRSTDGQILLEASTSYLYDSDITISNIKKIYGDRYDDLKIIIMLRNPIHRAWSHYNMHSQYMSNNLSFSESINDDVIKIRMEKGWGKRYDYISLGKYFDDVKNYIMNFSNIKFFFYDDFLKDPEYVFRELKYFLNIKSSHMPSLNKRYNMSGEPKNIVYKWLSNFIYKPNIIKDKLKFLIPRLVRHDLRVFIGQYLFYNKKIPENEKRLLRSIYDKDIKKLSVLLNKDLSSWLSE